jgi:hypothetical protein
MSERMRRAAAYKRGEQIFLHASCKTTAEVWIVCGPALVADQNDVASLGKAVLDALERSKENVPHPTQWKGIFDPLLRVAGVKSWNAFAKRAKGVEIEFGTNRISLIPTKNLGPKDGFDPLDAKQRSSSPVAKDLGLSLLSAFEASE